MKCLRVPAFVLGLGCVLVGAFCAGGPTYHEVPPGPDAGVIVSGPTPRSDGLRSGKRLRLRYKVTADGAQVPVGFWDDVHKVGCHAGTAADGKLRCLLDGASESQYVQDPACRVRLHLAPPCAEPYAFGEGNEGCARHVFRISAAATPGTLYYQQGSSCQAMPLPPELGPYTWYSRGAEVSPPELVEMLDGIGAPQ